MNKVLRIVLVVLICITLLSVFTPLTFTNVWVRNCSYIATLLLSIVVGVGINRKELRYVLIFLPLIFFLSIYVSTFNSFAKRATDRWRTSSISHRKDSRFVAEQMLDVGGRGYLRRTVLISPCTPIFEWNSKVDTAALDASWKRTNEIYNPYDLK